MKNDSPNKVLGTMASRLQAALGVGDGKNLMSQVSGGGLANAGALIGAGTRNATPAPVAPMAPTSGDMQDPFAGKTFSIVESPTNMKGNAKPVFSESTSNAAAMMYGSPTERQMSMPKAGTSAMAMSAKQAENLPPELVAEIKKKEAKEGSDGSSPLDSHHPQFFTGGREVTKKEFDSINKAEKAKTYLGGGQGLIPDALTGGKPTRQFLNESKLFNPTTAKEKVADLYDTKMMNAAGGNSITGNTDNAMYKYYKNRKKETRPNRTDRY